MKIFMKKNQLPGGNKVLASLLVCLLMMSAGCGRGGDSAVSSAAPFSAAVWGDRKEDILQAEGDDYQVYASVYGGDCFTFPKSYAGYEGTIKYMLNEKEELVSIAWTCSLPEEDEIMELYGELEQAVNEAVNESGGTTVQTSATGAVWHREEGNIILSTMLTSDLKALQYSYLHPEVSSPLPD